jgi:membrane protein required for beta-lactamase induction
MQRSEIRGGGLLRLLRLLLLLLLLRLLRGLVHVVMVLSLWICIRMRCR